MRKVPMPTERPEDIYRTCISKVKNPSLKRRLSNLEGEVIQSGTDFHHRALNGTLYQIPSKIRFRGKITANQLKKVYTVRMAKKNTPGRPFYDKVIASAPQGICPLCAQRTASTVDHYLAKSRFPIYAVLPLNLIPACKDCNTIKNEYPDPTCREEEILHPYFDDVESDPWLIADVIQGASPTIQFTVQSVSGWTLEEEDRVKYHFKVLELGNLYATHSAGELVNIKHSLLNLFAAGGSTAVQNHLNGEAQSRLRAHVNSWQTATYKALASSNWFCSAGYALI